VTAVPPFPPEHHVCADCGLSYVDLTAPAAIELVRTYPARYRRCLQDLPGAALRRRPGPRTWSALEYTCHVRDIYDVYHGRVVRALTEDDPMLAPMRNEERAERAGYNRQNLADVLSALERNANRFAELAEEISVDQWRRTATRLPGERRSVLWLVRQAAHEGLHHLHDIATLTADFQPAGPPATPDAAPEDRS
jgi:hypothetical protein